MNNEHSVSAEAEAVRDERLAAGPVTPAEARKILSRFNASHWRDRGAPCGEEARYSIPANPKRDDDIRLGAFIEHVEQLVAAAENYLAANLDADSRNELRAALANLKAVG